MLYFYTHFVQFSSVQFNSVQFSARHPTLDANP